MALRIFAQVREQSKTVKSSCEMGAMQRLVACSLAVGSAFENVRFIWVQSGGFGGFCLWHLVAVYNSIQSLR